MSFPLYGNEKVRFAVESAINGSRMPHALIIDGEAGLGRHTLAEYIVLSLVCTEKDKPCGKCTACKTVKSGSHPDVITVAPEEKKKNITVAQIRDLRQSAFVKPHSADCKVFIIDKAESMNEQAQNALLKILEEPPADIYFILITESAASLIETVLSRCFTLKLSPPPFSDGLKFIEENLRPKRDEDTVRAALESAKGNIGKAITLLKKKNADAAETAAKEFANIVFKRDEIEMLRILSKFEKDRVLADSFFVSLKYEMVRLIKENRQLPQRTKFLTELYSRIKDFEDSLKTNINLALLFSSLTATVKKLGCDYL